MTQPCLLIAGTQDWAYTEIEACSHQMLQATFVSLPGLNHLEGFLHSELVLLHVTQFLATYPR
jgi:hypothetical protein